MALEPYVIVDRNENIGLMQRMADKSQILSYSPSDMFGRATAGWFPRTTISQTRHMPAGHCRCNNNQMGLRSTKSDLYDSVGRGTGITSSVLLTDTSVSMSAYKDVDGTPVITKFPYNITEDCFISIRLKDVDGSSFSREMKILAWDNDLERITFTRPIDIPFDITDPSDIELDWIVYGYEQEQRVEIMSLDIQYALIANTQGGYNKNKSSGGQYES